MNRIGNIFDDIATKGNFMQAWEDYSKGKGSRRSIREFDEHKYEYIDEILDIVKSQRWKTSEYTYSKVYEPKERLLSKLPIPDHVVQWAILEKIEKMVCDSYIRQSCSCVVGRGTHDFIKMLYHSLYTYGKYGLYGVQLDAHHYFPNLKKEFVKREVRRKVKDKRLLALLEEFIDSHEYGLPLGVKISQIIANYYLSRFDHSAKECFGLKTDWMLHMRCRLEYIERVRGTARNRRQRREAMKDDDYLGRQFDDYVEKWCGNYMRFADNVVMYHESKSFLHIVTKLAIKSLEDEYGVELNGDWNVRPIWSGGIDVCGYVVFEDHIRLRKRNKVALCRQITALRKKGVKGKELWMKCASRIGFAEHADTKNLFHKMGINEIKTFKNKRRKRRITPFEGLGDDCYVKLSSLICHEKPDPTKLIMLLEVKECNSVINFTTKREKVLTDDGTYEWIETKVPSKCLAFKFKRIEDYIESRNADGEVVEKYIYRKAVGANGEPTNRDAEYFAITGSSVIMEDMSDSWDGEPCPVYIIERTAKNGKKFIKFE